MHKNPFPCEVWQLQRLQNFFKALLKGSLIAPEAQAAHSGVQLQMDRQGFAAGGGLGGIGPRHFKRGNVLCHAAVDQGLGHVGGGVSQQQDGQRKAVMAQLLRLLQIGHAQILGAKALQLSRNPHGPVAVGIRLHHAQILRLGPHPLPNGPVVVRQRIQVDFRPGPSQELFHTLTFKFSFVGVFCRSYSPAPPLSSSIAPN
ncbi:hypothetical protein SDC9_126643 [bioreactor metagenome]|uniref:Uncharacterized protein n=1 Tax=bioreactor metagenome TaxID=1076179 RepID=A0A645CRT3_9ZZZZ